MSKVTCRRHTGFPIVTAFGGKHKPKSNPTNVMTKSEVISHITQSYDHIPEDKNIEGFFLVTMTTNGRGLLAHGEIDLSQLQDALTSFLENTEG